MLFICSYSLSLSIKRSCTFSQDSPLRNTQLIEHLNQAFLQLYAVEQPLQLQEIILSQVSGADSLVVVIGVSPILFRFQPHFCGCCLIPLRVLYLMLSTKGMITSRIPRRW